MLLRHSHRVRVAATAVIFWAVLFAFLAQPYKAEAGGSGCRTDPIIILTNGAQLQMESGISTNLNNVESVVYTIHAPAGTRIALVLYTDNPLHNVERVQFYPDGPYGSYTIETVVELRSGGADVTTSSLLVNALGLTLDSDHARGRNHERLRMALAR